MNTNIINMTNIYKIVKSSTIENGLKRISTGDFGINNQQQQSWCGTGFESSHIYFV